MIKLLLAVLLISPLLMAAPKGPVPVETRLEEATKALDHFEEELTYRDRRTLGQTRWPDRNRLIPSMRVKYLEWRRLLEEQEKWTKALELKNILIDMYQDPKQRTKGVRREADVISQEIVMIMYRYRKEWKMLNSAVIHNMLINSKFKDKGFCWHWVEKFLSTLRPLGFQYYDFYWGVAYEGKFRENNSLVITKHDAPFDTGLMIDAWRSSGRPFWRPVTEDRFPWVMRDETYLWDEYEENVAAE